MVEQYGRWPPIYDAEDLANAIADLAGRPDLETVFFDSVTSGGPYCQGDVLQLSSGAPVIDADGEPTLVGDFKYWLAIGNTCDFDRELADVAWTQIVPLVDVSAANAEQLAALRAYRPSRRFFVPPWPDLRGGQGYAADLLLPAALHKQAIGSKALVVARVSRQAWALLHGCLIRFLARDDGRFAP